MSQNFRHGWGCEPDPAAAVRYLTAAASNAASIEQLALQAGLKKGGAAKGELVLAIFELANCFRHGWGIEKDAYAAKQVRLMPSAKTVNDWEKHRDKYYDVNGWLIIRGDSTTRLRQTWAIQVSS